MNQEQETYEQYRSLLYRVAFSHMNNHADAEDAVQETYVRLFKNRPHFDGSEHEKAWLIRTLSNVCHDIHKNAWNKQTVSMEHIAAAGTNTFVLPYNIEDEMLPLVLALDAKYRVPLYLFYYEGYAIREIAAFLDMPESTVKTHLKRGRELLKIQLEKEED